jgi:DNA-binding MarR family transcriptional regulator
MDQDLSRHLHAVTTRLDRAADAFLRAEAGISYSRFLTLVMVGAYDVDTQRALAERLGTTEPSVSRMTAVLKEAGYLRATADPAGGNRNRLALTPDGARLVDRWGGVLEDRLAVLVERAGVPYQTYRDHTKQLLDAVGDQ